MLRIMFVLFIVSCTVLAAENGKMENVELLKNRPDLAKTFEETKALQRKVEELCLFLKGYGLLLDAYSNMVKTHMGAKPDETLKDEVGKFQKEAKTTIEKWKKEDAVEKGEKDGGDH